MKPVRWECPAVACGIHWPAYTHVSNGPLSTTVNALLLKCPRLNARKSRVFCVVERLCNIEDTVNIMVVGDAGLLHADGQNQRGLMAADDLQCELDSLHAASTQRVQQIHEGLSFSEIVEKWMLKSLSNTVGTAEQDTLSIVRSRARHKSHEWYQCIYCRWWVVEGIRAEFPVSSSCKLRPHGLKRSEVHW